MLKTVQNIFKHSGTLIAFAKSDDTDILMYNATNMYKLSSVT